MKFLSTFLALFPKTSEIQRRSEFRFLHSMEQPLFNQIKEYLVGFEKAKLTILSPFFDSGAFLKEIDFEIKPFERIYIGPAECIPVRSTGIPLLESWVLQCPQVCTTENRKLHAKVISIEKESRSLLLVGSANATGAAWLGSYLNHSGNAEAIFLRSGEFAKSDFLESLLRAPAALIAQDIEDEKVESEFEITILDAEIKASRAQITFESDVEASGLVEIEFWGTDRQVATGSSILRGAEYELNIEVPPALLIQDGNAILVRIKLPNGFITLVSPWYWLSCEELIISSSADRTMRRATMRIQFGAANISDLSQLASYFVQLVAQESQMDQPGMDQKSKSTDSSDQHLEDRKTSQHTVSLAHHSLNQNMSSMSEKIDLITSAFQAILSNKKHVSDIASRAWRPVGDDVDLGTPDSKDLEDDGSSEVKENERYFLSAMRNCALSLLDHCNEALANDEKAMRYLNIAMQIMLLVKGLAKLKNLLILEPTDTINIRDSIIERLKTGLPGNLSESQNSFF